MNINFARVVDFAIGILPHEQPWILAVDELTKLPVESTVLKSILSTCTQWVHLSLQSSFQRCVVMTSFVPGLFDFLPRSNRPPIFISPSLLRAESCVAMAREFDLDPTQPLVMGAILMAAGHPRALYLGLIPTLGDSDTPFRTRPPWLQGSSPQPERLA